MNIFTFIFILGSFQYCKAEDSCDYVHKIDNNTDQCLFVKDSKACETDGGYINYAAVLYCEFQGSTMRPIGFVLFVLWFLYLLLATAVTSDRFFAPNLPVIADALKLSENVAGETLLALGNGAPDFFTSLVAAMGMKDGDAGILYGTLLGSGLFATTVVVATVVMIRPFRTMQRPLLKDICFYLCAVFCAFATLWDGEIRFWEACLFIVIYVVYIATVLSGPFVNRKLIKVLRKKRLARLAQTLQTIDHTKVAANLETNLEPTTHDAAEEVEDSTPRSAALHGIMNRERVVFASGIETPRRNVEEGTTPRYQLYAQSRATSRRNSLSRPRGFSIAPTPFSQSRVTSRRGSRIGEDFDGDHPLHSGQATPLPRSARLILRRASVRLNEATVLQQLSQADHDNGMEETTDMPIAQSRLASRLPSRLEEFLENDSDEEPVEKELELEALRFQLEKNPARSRRPSFSQQTSVSNDVFTIPMMELSRLQALSARGIATPVESRSRANSFGRTAAQQYRARAQQNIVLAEEHDQADEMPSFVLNTFPEEDEVQADEVKNAASNEVEEADEAEVIEDKPYWRWIIDGYNPIEMEEWVQQSWFGRMMQVLKAPIALAMLITNPVLDEDKPLYNWNRPVNCLHCIVSPVFVLLAIVQFDYMIGGKFPLIVIFLVLGITAAIAVFFTSKNVTRPKYHMAFAGLGFLTTVIWIYVLANEIVNLLQSFGLALSISQSILGLTVLAWGNSLGDLLNNCIIAQQGFSKMAISSCFGGMLFNLLLGLGVPLLIVSAKNGGVVKIEQANVVTVLFGFLAVELVSSFIAIPLVQKFYVRRPYAVYLYCLYACCILLAILTEVEVISPNIFTNARSYF